MCKLKGGPCIFEKLEAEGKIEKGSCYCMLKQEQEKSREVAAEERRDEYFKQKLRESFLAPKEDDRDEESDD